VALLRHYILARPWHDAARKHGGLGSEGSVLMPQSKQDDQIYKRLIDVALKDPFIRGIGGVVVIAVVASFATSALGSGPKAVIALALSLAFGVVLVVLRVLMKNVDSSFVRIVCLASSAVIMSVFLVFAVLLVPAAVICWPQPYAQLIGLPNCGLSVTPPPPAPTVNSRYTYTSRELGLTVIFPNNIFILNTTEEKQNHKLLLKNSEGQPLITISREALSAPKNVKLERGREIEELKRFGYSVDYKAPEEEENWSNWYVISGVFHGTEYYYRRWYCEDSMISIEFRYAKELAPFFDGPINSFTAQNPEFCRPMQKPPLILLMP
jgi:hypothetical protein